MRPGPSAPGMQALSSRLCSCARLQRDGAVWNAVLLCAAVGLVRFVSIMPRTAHTLRLCACWCAMRSASPLCYHSSPHRPHRSFILMRARGELKSEGVGGVKLEELKERRLGPRLCCVLSHHLNPQPSAPSLSTLSPLSTLSRSLNLKDLQSSVG